MLELKILLKGFSRQPLFFFFKTKITRPIFLLYRLVQLGEEQLHKYIENDHVV